MIGLLQRALDQSLALNERAAAIANNAFDWVFLRETLVKSGQTPFELVHEGDPMSLRYYAPPPGQVHALPLVLVPPLGVTTETFDLLPTRSLVRHMAASGFNTYLIDWGKPERRHAHLGLKDYALTMMSEALQKVREHSGSKEVSLMGWCMGGLLCLIHLGATGDAKVRNLVTVASPIDLRGGGIVARTAMALNTPARLIRKFSGFRLHNLDPQKLHAPAWLTTLGFKLTDPIGSITTYWDLLTRLWDREFVERHTTTSDYLNNMLLYPGGVIQDMVVKMAVDNRLAEGRIEVGGRVADLRKIRANVLVFAGDSDHLVPAQIARRSVELVASKDREFRIAPGGHMGVILGGKAQHAVWAQSADWLAQRSGSRGRRTAQTDQRRRAHSRRREAEDPTL